MLTPIVLPPIAPAAFAAGEQVAAAGQTGFQMASTAPSAIADAGNLALGGILGQVGQTAPQGGQLDIVNTVGGLVASLIIIVAFAHLKFRYGTNITIDGQDVAGFGGFMPARSFPEVVVDRMTHSLRIFYKFDELQKAWKDAPENDRVIFGQYTNENGEHVAVITRQPYSAGNSWFPFSFSSAYKVIYTYTDGELREVVARRFGGILADRDYKFTPHRKLPPAKPPAGKEAITQVAEIGDDTVAFKIHPLARAEGDEIKIFPTVDDFKLAFGEPKDVKTKTEPPKWDDAKDRRTIWRGTGQSEDTETIALFEFTKPTTLGGAFADRWRHDTTETDGKQTGIAYSAGILEVIYDSKGRRADSLEPERNYTSYEVRYNYGRDGSLLRAIILKRDFSLSDWETRRISLESRVLFTYKPNERKEHRDSTAASDRPE